MDLLNASGDQLARDVQRGLVRAGLRDVTALSVDPKAGRRLILRRGPHLYRMEVRPAVGLTEVPSAEPGWITLVVDNRFDDTRARQLTDMGVSFLDDRGNVHLALDGATVALTAGRTEAPVAAPAGPAGQRGADTLALNRASHRVAFALLCRPTLAGGPIRELAAAAKVSVGTVHNTLAQLASAGFLLDGDLHDTGRLLDTWAEAYQRLTVRSLSDRALYAPDGNWPGALAQEPQDMLLGGAAAAALLDDHFRATDGLVYTAELGPAVTRLRLTTAVTAFPVEVRQRFWGDGLPSPRADLTPSILIYGDLLRDNDARSVEMAARLRSSDAHLRTLDR
ncbi:type IV toxin-antitoxin system AbiEi family antitoxin [Tessaracoccus lacteus]|uniref:Type IV toxin-antitoxin system AbiEi family antitoxin n=1 Tax=Tessaracoccus lacteus TaxID=3041766 RepID=A0ABY8PV23_9ACTN|nr:type IV toxin-antitoxin system AbiEi family antitoxin [Tessaracoccus sp. T21]WGT46288.1 type IV toxin-antitoxin system AbiEi family antitoxin [Tessaracoccus sp. T21]